MVKEQEDAYKEAIQNYRTISQARISKLSEVNSDNVARILSRRQISNYFHEFRKVLCGFLLSSYLSEFYKLESYLLFS